MVKPLTSVATINPMVKEEPAKEPTQDPAKEPTQDPAKEADEVCAGCCCCYMIFMLVLGKA